MTHYIALLEEEEGKAVGVWFPDLPGCFSAGDTLDEAIQGAAEAIVLYAEALERDGRRLPPPRALSVLKDDAGFAAEVQGNLVALISAPERIASAAE